MTTATDTTEIEALVERARGGDKAALEAVLRAIQDGVYNLALRMLWHPEDAADATQEILIRVLTHLGQFEGRSAFWTWVYRIATNYLLTTRTRRAEGAMRVQPDTDTVANTPLPDDLGSPEVAVLFTETQSHCTLGMLLCLDRELRIAFILGTGFRVSSEEGAAILDITPAAFRKRLSRARARLHAAMTGKCHLVDPNVACTCVHRPGFAEQVNDLFGDLPPAPIEPARLTGLRCDEITELDRVSGLFRAHPAYAAPETFIAAIQSLLASDRYPLLQ